MNKTLKISLLLVAACAIIGSVYYFFFKKDTKTATIGTGGTNGGTVGTTLPVASTDAASKPASTLPGALVIRRVYAANGDVAALVTKTGKSEAEILQFLTYDANYNKRGEILNWVPTWWVNNTDVFTKRFNDFKALTDEEYNKLFTY